jgi:hypothetical protein
MPDVTQVAAHGRYGPKRFDCRFEIAKAWVRAYEVFLSHDTKISLRRKWDWVMVSECSHSRQKLAVNLAKGGNSRQMEART